MRARLSLAIGAMALLVGAGAPYAVMIRMPGRSFHGSLPALTPIEVARRDRMGAGIEHLAGAIGERNVDHPDALVRAADWIKSEFAEAGFAPQEWPYQVGSVTCTNIEVNHPGTTGDIVLVGAHYDSAQGTPGANDNGSGVVALLALARELHGRTFARSIRFVAFANEEPPHFRTADMGSRVYAHDARTRGDRITAMLSLETMGSYFQEDHTQKYPFPLSLVYPSQGNFIAFVGNVASRELVRRAVGTFRQRGAFPSEGAALPGSIPGVGWSDHESFWHQGYPAVMVTDTAPFRYPHYHLATDTPDKVDYESLSRVVSGLVHVVEDLANH